MIVQPVTCACSTRYNILYQDTSRFVNVTLAHLCLSMSGMSLLGAFSTITCRGCRPEFAHFQQRASMLKRAT